jgi:hypothetical protein
MVSNDRIVVNNEMERTWKEVAVIQTELLSWHLPAGTEENQEHHPLEYLV